MFAQRCAARPPRRGAAVDGPVWLEEAVELGVGTSLRGGCQLDEAPGYLRRQPLSGRDLERGPRDRGSRGRRLDGARSGLSRVSPFGLWPGPRGVEDGSLGMGGLARIPFEKKISREGLTPPRE